MYRILLVDDETLFEMQSKKTLTGRAWTVNWSEIVKTAKRQQNL